MMDFYLNSTIAGYLSCLPRQLFQHFKTKKRCHTTHGVCVSPPCLLSNEAPKKKEREKKRAFVSFSLLFYNPWSFLDFSFALFVWHQLKN
jgi:hypothetical protein